MAVDFDVSFRGTDAAGKAPRVEVCWRQVELAVEAHSSMLPNLRSNSFAPYDGPVACAADQNRVVSLEDVGSARSRLWWRDTYLSSAYRFGEYGLDAILVNGLYNEAYRLLSEASPAIERLGPGAELKIRSIKPVVEIVLASLGLKI